MYYFKSNEELIKYLRENVLSTSEAYEYLGITRQGLNKLVKRGKIIPFKKTNREMLFLKSDLEKRREEAKLLREKYQHYIKEDEKT